MELTLKDQSVIEIGKEIGDRVGQFQSTGTALVPAGVGAMPGGGATQIEAQPMNPFDSMMAVLSDMRDGIYALVDKFSEGVSIQQENQDMMQAEAQAESLGATEASIEDTGGVEDNRSFLEKGKEKVSELMNAGGLKGLLVKGGLIFGLLGIAKLLQKYGKQIAEAVTPIVDGIKAFFMAFSDDIGPLFDKAVGMIKDLFGGLIDIFKGLFSGDAGTFFTGVKKIFVDFPIKLVSYIGDAFFSLLENALAAFGIESKMVTDIKNFFRELPEKIGQLFTDIGNFFTVTIPEKYEEIKTNVANFFTDMVSDVKSFFSDIGSFFTETIPEKFTSITDSITEKFTKIKDDIIDFAMRPFTKIKELMNNMLIGILESVENLPFIGDKAKALKASLLGEPASGGPTVEEMSGPSPVTIGIPQTDGTTAKVTMDVQGNVTDPKTGKILKLKDQDAAKVMASELTMLGGGDFVPYYNDGGFFGREYYGVRQRGLDEPSQDYSLGGVDLKTLPETNDKMIIEPKPDGSNLNRDSADFASAQGQGGNNTVMTGGNVSTNTTNAVQQTVMAEDTRTNDFAFNSAIT